MYGTKDVEWSEIEYLLSLKKVSVRQLYVVAFFIQKKILTPSTVNVIFTKAFRSGQRSQRGLKVVTLEQT